MYTEPEDKKNRKIGGGFSTNPETPTVSHADFVAETVLPSLETICNRFGQEAVATDIVELTLPIYAGEEQVSANSPFPDYYAAAFLSCTLRGGREIGNISANVTNPQLVEKYGMKYVFGPICELGIVHMTTNVFNPSKYFHHQACRMGEVIDNFSQADYIAYIEVAKNLLRHGIYDWSIEHSPEEWGMLRPVIKLHGMSAVLSALARPMIDIAHLPGTKEVKYKYSLMHYTIRGLLPILLPKVRSDGVDEIDKMLGPIAEFVLDLSKEGAFRHEAYDETTEGKFFCALVDNHLDDIKQVGVKRVLQQIRLHWLRELTKPIRDSRL